MRPARVVWAISWPLSRLSRIGLLLLMGRGFWWFRAARVRVRRRWLCTEWLICSTPSGSVWSALGCCWWARHGRFCVMWSRFCLLWVKRAWFRRRSGIWSRATMPRLVSLASWRSLKVHWCLKTFCILWRVLCSGCRRSLAQLWLMRWFCSLPPKMCVRLVRGLAARVSPITRRGKLSCCGY